MTQKSYTSIDEYNTPDLVEDFAGSGVLDGLVTGGFTWEKEATDPDQTISGGVVTWTRTGGVETHILPVTSQPRIIKVRAKIAEDTKTIELFFRCSDGYASDSIGATTFNLRVTRTDSAETLTLQFREDDSPADATLSDVGTAPAVVVSDASDWFVVTLMDNGTSMCAFIEGYETIANMALHDSTAGATEPEFGIGSNITGTMFDYVKVWY